jgi:hypothetical protein
VTYSACDPSWERHCAEPAVEAAGIDWVQLGGCPRSWREAAELYRRLGVRCLADAVTVVLGPPIPVKQAMRGDIVMVDGALGICRGEWAEFLDHMQPMKRATQAWRSKGA